MGLFRRAAPTTPADLAEVRSEMASLREALEQPDTRFDQLASKLAELDARMTAISTELANQVTELGHDLDSLGARATGDGDDDAVLGDIHDGQVRLANEQARYQMAFREDLARLADELKRPR